MGGDFPFDQFMQLERPNIKVDPPPLASSEDDEKSNYYSGLSKSTPPLKNNKILPTKPKIELNDLKIQFFGQLKSLIPQTKFNTYFVSTFFIEKIDHQLSAVICSVTTQFIKRMVEGHYLLQLQQVFDDLLGFSYTIQINVKAKETSLSSNKNNILGNLPNRQEQQKSLFDHMEATEQKAKSAREARFTIDLMPSKRDLLDQVDSKVINHLDNTPTYAFHIDSKKNFETFVVGPSNNMAFASALAVAKNPGKVYPSLYFHSSSGLGKTHLLHSVGNYLKENNPTLKICLITAREFMNEMVESMANKRQADFRKKYSETIDVLMVDDVHELKNKSGTQNEFFHVFNELYNKGKQLLFTSDKPPKEIDGLEERLKTRLTWGLVLDIQPPDFETRVAILKKKAQEEDYYLPEDVIALIASSVKSSIRELEGSLIRLAAYSSVFKVDIDIEIAKEQLKINEQYDGQGHSLESIARGVSKYYKIPVADLTSKVRKKDVTLARHISMYLSYKLLQATLAEIGLFYGNRDHTSVLHAIEKVKKQLSKDIPLNQLVRDIEETMQ